MWAGCWGQKGTGKGLSWKAWGHKDREARGMGNSSNHVLLSGGNQPIEDKEKESV